MKRGGEMTIQGYSIEEALNWLINEYGSDVLWQPQRAYDLLSDKITGDIRARERICLRVAFTSGAIDLLIEASENDLEVQRLIQDATTLLKSNRDVSEEIVDETIQSFINVLHIEMKSDEIKYTPVSSSEKGRLKKALFSIVAFIGLYHLCQNPNTSQWTIGFASAFLCVAASYLKRFRL